MSETASDARETLIATGVELFRRAGYTATSVDDICRGAGVTKGAFFHHFRSKEDLATSCLARWNSQIAAMDQGAAYQSISRPAEKLLACMDFYIQLFSTPKILKSCLAGTTVQEVSETHPALRDSANACFVASEQRFRALLDAAFGKRRSAVDTASLARLWVATLQGSIILAKASGDEDVIPRSLGHVKQYIQTLLTKRSKPDRTKKEKR